MPLDQCALARAIDEIGDAWTLLILREVVCGARRFGDMQAELGISRAALTERLTLLVERGILLRHPVHEPGKRRQHDYRPSEKGQALLPTLVALREWSGRFVSGPPSPLRPVTPAGEAIEIRPSTRGGRSVSPDEIVVSTVPD